MREGPHEDEVASGSADPLAETQIGEGGGATAIGAGDSGGPSEGLEATPGDRLGRYRLLRVLGGGGMGIVHLAHDDELDRPVALKVLRPGGNGDSRRLLREARSMARLAHPHIAAVYDVGEHEGDVYVAMEYVEGPTLRAWMSDAHDWAERLEVLVQAGRGLVAAHARGVVHRDFKPENVIVGQDGRVRVLDFGLAKLAPRAAGPDDSTDTQLGAIVGTPRYMAPEQLRGRAAGPLADQFAFCVTAYELAYGQRPFSGEVFADVAASVLTQPPREPSPAAGVPEGLWPLLRRGMQVEQGERFPSMQALVDALDPLCCAPAGVLVPSAVLPAPIVSRPALRDAREDARAQLTHAYAEDLLDADELDSRLERLENASDLPIVAALVADLVVAAPAPAPASAPAPALPVPVASSVPAVIDVPAVSRTVAVFSGTRRAGTWMPARVNHVFSVFGGADIDLRDAVLPPGELEIRVFCMFGGVDITVAPGTHVHVECTAIFGGTDQDDASVQPEPGATVVRVTGLVMFGAVDVHERLPGESGWGARKRRKAARRELEAQRSKKALPPKR